jgi:hypothetical protein
LQDIQSKLAQGSFHPDARKYSFGSYLDLRTGKVVVNTDAPEAVMASMRSQFASNLDTRPGALRQQATRQFDVQKFYAGAAISSNTNVCTAGFTVVNGVSSITGEGQRSMMVPAHCFPLGTAITTNGGGLPFGTVTNMLIQTTPSNADAALIRLLPNDYTGQTYDSRMYVGAGRDDCQSTGYRIQEPRRRYQRALQKRPSHWRTMRAYGREHNCTNHLSGRPTEDQSNRLHRFASDCRWGFRSAFLRVLSKRPVGLSARYACSN